MPERYWQRHEREVAALLGGQMIPRSGAGAEKLDVRVSSDENGWFSWLVSCKSTTSRGVRITDQMLEEAEVQASLLGPHARPMLAVRLYDPTGRRVRYDWVGLRIDDWAEVTQR